MSVTDDHGHPEQVSIATTDGEGPVAMSESEDPDPTTEAGDADRDAEVEAAERALNDLPDGSGCAEIWDYLSERRRQD